MFECENVKNWAIKEVMENREKFDLESIIIHTKDVSKEASKLNPCRTQSKVANGCVEIIPNSICEMKIIIDKKLYKRIEQRKILYNGKLITPNKAWNLWYVETLSHECQHYFELKNLYNVFTNGKCIKNEDIDALKQVSEYNAKRVGYFNYYKSVDYFNVIDESYLINDLKDIREFYKKNRDEAKNIAEFLYYQIRLLAIVSAWEDYFGNDIAKDILLSEFFDKDIMDSFWQCLRVNLEMADKETLVKTIDDFLKIINCSKVFSCIGKN